MKAVRGRTNRQTYWLSIAIVAVLLALLAVLTGTPPRVTEVVLVFASVPRLHDIGRSGWLVLWPIALEAAAAILGIMLLPAVAFAPAMGVVVLVIAGLMIWLGCVPGDPAANRFGEPPVGFGWKARGA